MRTDFELNRDVMAELTWDPSIRNEDIAVAVHEGVVTLAGVVDSFAQRIAAERAVQRVKGVKALANDLTVKLPSGTERTDPEIAHAAVNALNGSVEVPRDRIQVKVVNGLVTLTGKVDWEYQRRAAERAVRYLWGVQALTNLISVREIPTPSDVQHRISDALKRQAEVDANQITVETSGHAVTLRGTVRSLAEKRDAERAAWGARGVTRVENGLAVEPSPALVL